MKNVLIVALGSLLLVGCGGGGSKSDSFVDQLKTRDIVDVLYNYPPATCERLPSSDLFDRYKDVITKVESSDTSCSLLDLPEKTKCTEHYEDFDFSESCVVGYNR